MQPVKGRIAFLCLNKCIKLDASQSLTVARPAITIPIAACFIGQLIGSPASSAALALLVGRMQPSSEWHANPILWKTNKIGCHGNVP